MNITSFMKSNINTQKYPITFTKLKEGWVKIIGILHHGTSSYFGADIVIYEHTPYGYGFIHTDIKLKSMVDFIKQYGDYKIIKIIKGRT